MRLASLVAACLLICPLPGFGADDATAVDQNGKSRRWKAPFNRVTVVDFAAAG